MAHHSGENRRGKKRLPLKALITCRTKDGEPIEAEVSDICANGLCFKSSRRFPVGEALSIETSFLRDPLSLEGKVAWSQGSCSGLHFGDMPLPAKARLADFLHGYLLLSSPSDLRRWIDSLFEE